MILNRQIIILIPLLLSNKLAFAQNIVLVDQTNESLTRDWNYFVSITLDKKTTFSFQSEKALIRVPSIKCDSLIEFKITGPSIQPYYNQYYCYQFDKLDTIQLVDRTIIEGQTPRLLLGKTVNKDSIYTSQLWFKDWLFEYKDHVDGISFWVNNSEQLTKKEKRFVKECIRNYCLLIDKKEFINHVFFKDECYTTGQEDLFNAGTQITKNFIDSQNTIDMKNKAEKYSTVVTVEIEWKKH